MRKIYLVLFLIITFSCARIIKTEYKTFSVYISPVNIYKGGIAIINFENLNRNKSYRLIFKNDKQKYSYKLKPKEGFTTFYLGIPLSADDISKIELYENKKIIWEQNIKLHSKPVDFSKIIVNQRYVTPPKKLLNRIRKEQEILNNAKSFYKDNFYIDTNPIFPIENGIITTPYGFKRIYNHSKKSIHYGLDIAAKEGTQIKAVTTGEVILIGNFYYTGNTVLINSGKGIVIMYAHLSKFNVAKGDFVNAGDIIGFVGQTGCATGPHLHLGIYIHRIPVDPQIFFDVFKM